MSIVDYPKAFFGAVLGLVSFAIAGFGYLLSYGSYSSLKGKQWPFFRSLKDWVLPYEPKSYWENRAKTYLEETKQGWRELPDSNRKLLNDSMLDSLNKASFSSLLEIGCGFGRNLKTIADSFSGKELAGIDISVKMVSNAKEHLKLYPKIRVERQDAKALSFKDNSFDIAFSCETLIHVPKKEIRKAVKELVRVSKKYVVLIEPNLARIPLFQRTFHAKQVFFHNYPNLFSETGKTQLFYKTSIPYQFRTVYIFKKQPKVIP